MNSSPFSNPATGRHLIFKLLLASSVLPLFSGCVVAEPRRVRTVVVEPAPATVVVPREEPIVEVVAAPPPPRREVIVERERPSPRHVWVAGYWAWRGGRHVWVSGHWELPPRPGMVWIAPRWEHRGGGYVFVSGRWR
jgi:hypothetical protein